MKKLFKYLAVVFVLASVLISCAVIASADVEFQTSKIVEDDDIIVISGNPDLFPYEYYDKESGEYLGLFPDLYKYIYSETGIDLLYIGTGESDSRLADAKSGYSDIVSAYVVDEKQAENYRLKEIIPIVEYEKDGQKTTIAIAFGHYASAEKIAYVKEGLALVTDEQINSILAKYIAIENAKRGTLIYIIILIFLFLVFLGIVGFISYIMIKDRKIKNQKKKQKYIDPLTKLYNREYLETEFKKLLTNRDKDAYNFAYIGFDINKVNRYYGEEAAEEQLCRAAELLKSTKLATDYLARISGGGFGMLHLCTTEAETNYWARTLSEKLNANEAQFKKDFVPTFKVGVYRILGDRWDFEKSFKYALECYQNSIIRGQNYFVSDQAMEERIRLQNTLSHDVGRAIDENEFRSYLQPIVDCETGAIIGAENLARWNHPRLGLLRPSRFVHVMIEDGQVMSLDLEMFEKACAHLEEWKHAGKDYRISTNFTRVTITDDGLIQRISQIVGKYVFNYSKLVIEITEDSLEGSREIALENVKTLKQMGFKIALDDVGSGFTFFEDLKDYPLDVIKIDRDVLLESQEERGRIFMRGIIDVCKNMGMEVVCEGVETRAQYQLVRALHCNFIQGYYFYKPLSEEEIVGIM